MDHDEVIAVAAEEGFELEERLVNGKWCWGSVRRCDNRYPVLGERRQAIGYMRDRLRRGAPAHAPSALEPDPTQAVQHNRVVGRDEQHPAVAVKQRPRNERDDRLAVHRGCT